MFRDFSKSAFANGCLGIMNEDYRKRSKTELFIRAGLNAHPLGAVADTCLNVGEMYGHQQMNNINEFNRMNIMNHSNGTERNWDSFKRATDIEYSAGNDCNIF